MWTHFVLNPVEISCSLCQDIHKLWTRSVRVLWAILSKLVELLESSPSLLLSMQLRF